MKVIPRIFTHNRPAALLCYIVVVAALIASAFMTVGGIFERQAALASAADILDRLSGRRPPAGATTMPPQAAPMPAGNPFLEGRTLTIAGAALMQRVAGAIQKYGGTVLSSQVALDGDQAKHGMVNVIVSSEVGQPELQQLLYDIEAGMPFLFVEQLIIQSPQGTGGEPGRMRVLLGVSGQWDNGR